MDKELCEELLSLIEKYRVLFNEKDYGLCGTYPVMHNLWLNSLAERIATQNTIEGVPMKAKVKRGWDQAGTEFEVVGANVFINQWWTPIKEYPDSDEPSWFKTAALDFEESAPSASTNSAMVPVVPPQHAIGSPISRKQAINLSNKTLLRAERDRRRAMQ